MQLELETVTTRILEFDVTVPSNVVRVSRILESPSPAPHAIKLVVAYASSNHEHIMTRINLKVVSRFLRHNCPRPATNFVSNVAAWINPGPVRVPAEGPLLYYY